MWIILSSLAGGLEGAGVGVFLPSKECMGAQYFRQWPAELILVLALLLLLLLLLH